MVVIEHCHSLRSSSMRSRILRRVSPPARPLLRSRLLGYHYNYRTCRTFSQHRLGLAANTHTHTHTHMLTYQVCSTGVFDTCPRFGISHTDSILCTWEVFMHYFHSKAPSILRHTASDPDRWKFQLKPV